MKGWRLKKFFDTEKDCDLFAEEKYSQGSEQQKNGAISILKSLRIKIVEGFSNAWDPVRNSFQISLHEFVKRLQKTLEADPSRGLFSTLAPLIIELWKI